MSSWFCPGMLFCLWCWCSRDHPLWAPLRKRKLRNGNSRWGLHFSSSRSKACRTQKPLRAVFCFSLKGVRLALDRTSVWYSGFLLLSVKFGSGWAVTETEKCLTWGLAHDKHSINVSFLHPFIHDSWNNYRRFCATKTEDTLWITPCKNERATQTKCHSYIQPTFIEHLPCLGTLPSSRDPEMNKT